MKTSVRHIKTKGVRFLAKHIGGIYSLLLHYLVLANTLHLPKMEETIKIYARG
jgi:hypothetical protein